MSLSVEQMHHEKSLLLFRVEPYRICVPSVDVEAIITVPTFRSIPQAPFAMRGVFSYRGQIASVISLRLKFGLHDYKDANTGQLVLARISCGLTGFWVDEVLDIVASTGEDVIALPVLSRLTVFDHFLILDDQIAQHTTFELIYQAPDASPRQRSPEHSVLNQEVEAGQGEKADDRPSVGTAEVIPLDTVESAGEEADPAVCQAADENVRQPDAKKKGIEARPGRKFDSTADVVDLRSHRTKNQGASSTFRLKSRSAPAVIKRSKQSRHPSDRRQTAVGTVNLSDRFSRVRIAHQSVAGSHIQPEVAGRSTRQRRYSIFAAGILLLAGLILLTYWLWPQDKRFITVARVLETEKITVTADPIPTASSKDASRKLWSEIEGQQDTARSIPIRDNSAVAEKIPGTVASTGDTLGDSAGKLRSEIEEEQYTSQSLPADDNSPVAEKASDSVTATSEKVGEKIGITADGEPKTEPDSESHVAQTASMKASNTAESENRLLKIETDDFTLTIERGQSGKTQQPPQKASAPTERTGDTEPSPAGVAPVFATEHTHIVVKGDTLWDIAAKYLGNPFQYPELAELSRIKDPHWIYPGDLIRIIKKKVPGKSNQ